MDNEYDFMKILFVVMVIVDFIGIIVFIILGYMVSRRMLKFIDYIIEIVENISINNLKEWIDIKGLNDEFKRFVSIFNNMIDRF